MLVECSVYIMPLIARALMENLPLDVPWEETTDVHGKIISHNDFIRKSKTSAMFRSVSVPTRFLFCSFFAVALDTICMKSSWSFRRNCRLFGEAIMECCESYLFSTRISWDEIMRVHLHFLSNYNKVPSLSIWKITSHNYNFLPGFIKCCNATL